ncbi:hypothetical protein GGR51DRAFT_565816 [Nemania sp. FL0031]|nr:hypothetical protein GGR51DRAFT_565816 [Nemania sp. FL0031]
MAALMLDSGAGSLLADWTRGNSGQTSIPSASTADPIIIFLPTPTVVLSGFLLAKTRVIKLRQTTL